ncbi:hypothetical protein [Micromonospora sp. NPDC047738]|uniref:hypothetical protein n=1 Tax=unclassified Micromonospora TaxID=2617518 RepID=UPI0033E5B28E
MSDREFHCDTCEGVALFEAPPCVDGHGADCPDDCSESRRGVRHAEPKWSELVCTGCGAAQLIATFAFHAPRLEQRRRGTRPVHRRAA